MKKKTLACCYTRFSTEHQNQSSTIGQLKAIRAYCDKNNIEIIDTYIDEAQSGTNTNRKDFQRLLADAPTALWDTVVVYNMSRLSRSVKDTLNIKEEFERLGKKIISVIENQEETPEGDFFNLITYGMNELFIKQFARDSWRGLMVNANEAKALGGVPLYGYSISKDRKYIINEEEAKAVRIVFNMYLEGYSYKSIARFLNENGYRRRKGQLFTANFTDLLRNEKYKGIYVWNLREGKKKLGRKTNRVCKPESEVVRIEGGVPAIIDGETFDKIQAILDKRKKYNIKRGPKAKYLLTGLVKCGYCGGSLGGQYTFSGTTRNYRALYRCNVAKAKVLKCQAKDINMLYLDWYVKKVLTDIVLDVDNTKIYQEGINELSSRKRQKVLMALEEIEQNKEEIRLKSIGYAELLSGAKEDEYIRLMKEISWLTSRRAELEIEELEVKKEESLLYRLSQRDIKSMLVKYRQMMRTQEKEELRTILSHLIERVVVDNERVVIEINVDNLFGKKMLDTENPLILPIAEDRNLVCDKRRHDRIVFSGDKLIKAFEVIC